MSVVDQLLENNETYAASFDKGDLAAAPTLKLAVLTCMDARIDVLKVLGLTEGQAHVIRNAGGLASEDALRSLVISHRVLGTEELIIIQHTQCGMLTLDDDEMRREIAAETGHAPPFELGAIPDLESSVREAVSGMKQNPFIDFQTVRGFVYEVETGRLREVS